MPLGPIPAAAPVLTRRLTAIYGGVEPAPRRKRAGQDTENVRVLVSLSVIPARPLQVARDAFADVVVRLGLPAQGPKVPCVRRPGDAASVDRQDIQTQAGATSHAVDTGGRSRLARPVRRKVLAAELRTKGALLGEEGARRSQPSSRLPHRPVGMTNRRIAGIEVDVKTIPLVRSAIVGSGADPIVLRTASDP